MGSRCHRRAFALVRREQSHVLAVNANTNHKLTAQAQEDRHEGRHVQRSPPAWLDPPPGRERKAWRSEMWAAVLALHHRYQDALSALPGDWWRDPPLIEVLGALVT